MRRVGGTLRLDRVLDLDGGPSGMALVNHDSLLIVAAGDGIAFIDVSRAVAGKRNAVLGFMTDGVVGAGRVYANATADGKLAFISDERTQSITVIDLRKAVKERFQPSAIIGKIPVGQSPIALTFSPDGRLLYTTSQSAPAAWRWPIECKPEAATAPDVSPNHAQGAILVFDVAKAGVDPAHSLVAATRAGCNPVRLILSPTGDRAFVSARAMNAILVFDTDRIMTDSAHALTALVPVGVAPVGIALIDSARTLVVTSSNRFAGPTDPQTLTVVAADRVAEGAKSVVGVIAAGAFPRELRQTADGRTLILTNYGSRTVQMIDIARLPVRRVP